LNYTTKPGEVTRKRELLRNSQITKFKFFAGIAGCFVLLWGLSILVVALGIKLFSVKELETESIVWMNRVMMSADGVDWCYEANHLLTDYLKVSGIVLLFLTVAAIIMMGYELKHMKNRADLSVGEDKYYAEQVIRLMKTHVLNLEDRLEKTAQLEDSYAVKNGEKRIIEEAQAANRDLEAFLVKYRKK